MDAPRNMATKRAAPARVGMRRRRGRGVARSGDLGPGAKTRAEGGALEEADGDGHGGLDDEGLLGGDVVHLEHDGEGLHEEGADDGTEDAGAAAGEAGAADDHGEDGVELEV